MLHPSNSPILEVVKRFTFDAAHRLPNVPSTHRCFRIHGHTYSVDVAVQGPLEAHLGWVVDFGDIKSAVKPVIDRLDHFYLNDIRGLENPTAEHIAVWLSRELAPKLPGFSAITVFETPQAWVTLRLKPYPPTTLELPLPQAPDGAML